VSRRILDAHIDNYDHDCWALVARNDSIATFRGGPREGQEIWIQLRIEPGANAFYIVQHWCDGVDPVRDWPVFSWLRYYGYDRMGYSAGREFTLGQLKRVAPAGIHWRRPIAGDAAHFLAFHEPGCAKVAMSFVIHVLGRGWYRLDIERRVFAPDARTARAYARPWRLSRPARDAFFALWLGQIKHSAEHWNANCGTSGLRNTALPDTLLQPGRPAPRRAAFSPAGGGRTGPTQGAPASPPRAWTPRTVCVQAVGKPAVLPGAYALGPITPNPFSARARIAFEVPRAARIEIHVYDVGGRRIETLHDGLTAPGRYAVVWDVRAGRQQVLLSGIYFVEMRAPGFRQVRRVALLR
jgi:hypothetical protein